MKSIYDYQFADSFVLPFVHLCDITSLYANAGYEDEIYIKLKKVRALKVYKKEEMDPSFHYKNNRRIMPITVSTVEGYRLCKNAKNCGQLLGNA